MNVLLLLLSADKILTWFTSQIQKRNNCEVGFMKDGKVSKVTLDQG